MSAFDLYPTEPSITDVADFNDEPGVFTGAFSGAASGIGRLITDTQRVTGLAVGAIAGSFDELTGSKLQDSVFQYVVEPADRLSRRFKPDPHEVGFAGQLLYGLTKIGGEAALLGPTGTFVLESIGETMDQMSRGVDLDTARKIGLVHGVATTAGVIAPMTLGARTSALSNALYGAEINLAQGMFERGATAEMLRKAGYNDMAEQYQALDIQAMLVDAVLGSAFSGIGRAMQKKFDRPFLLSEPRPSDIDAALTTNQALHAELNAPGLPKDLATREAHVNNLYGAIDDLLEGRPVSLRENVGDYIPNHIRDANRKALADDLNKIVNEMIKRHEEAAMPAVFKNREQRSADSFKFQKEEAQLPSQAEIGAKRIAEVELNDALQRISKGETLVELPKQPTTATEGINLSEAGRTPRQRIVFDGQPETTTASAGAEAKAQQDIPEVAIAKEIASTMPENTVRLEDGQNVSMQQAVAMIDEFKRVAAETKKGIDAAVRCFLRMP